MFRFVKISLLTISSTLTIFGFIMVFLGAIVIYLNRKTIQLFITVEDLCKEKSDQFGGTELTTVFEKIGVQAYISLPLGVCICFAGVLSVMGAGNLSAKLLKISLVFWIFSVITLLVFLIYSVVSREIVGDAYMYCWLSVLTDTLQKKSDKPSEMMVLMHKTEIFLECCGVRGPSDYYFYGEIFGTNRYPKSCCHVKKLDTFDCREDHVQTKVGCYYGVRDGIRNREMMFTFITVICTLCVCPIIMELLWMIRGIYRRHHVHQDDMEASSDGSEGGGDPNLGLNKV